MKVHRILRFYKKGKRSISMSDLNQFCASLKLIARYLRSHMSLYEWYPAGLPLVHTLFCSLKGSYFRVNVISIVEIILVLLSPSLGGISSVPMVILPMLRSFMNLFLAISTASTAVIIACPLAFKVTSLALDPVKLVIIPRT